MTTQQLSYETDGVTFKGYYAAPQHASRLAGVLVVPEAPGLGAHAKRRVDALAQAGYAALGVDLHGEGALAASPDQARAWVGDLKAHPARLIARLDAALRALSDRPEVDAGRLAAAGYCFGGWCALELARAGRPLRSVTVFHGSLASARGAEAIAGSVLVCTGDSDPFVPIDQVLTFQAEMRAAGVDYEICLYGGVRHGFTDAELQAPDPAFGYSPRGDAHSWASFMRELAEAVGGPACA
jgi:dienelactone hydrolase